MTRPLSTCEYVAAEVSAEARHQEAVDGIAEREQALMALGRPVALAEIRDAHQMTAAQMARALGISEGRVAALEASGLAPGNREDVRAYLSVLVLRLADGIAHYGGTRIPLW